MTDPLIMARIFSIAVIVVIAITLIHASTPRRENWPRAGWGFALFLEAARRAIEIASPGFLAHAPIPGDTIQLMVMSGLFIAAASGRRRNVTTWVASSLGISAIAAVTSASRPDLAALFVPSALILAGLATWRWRRPTMMIAAAATLGWGGLHIAELLMVHKSLEPASLQLATALLALVSGLAILADMIVPARYSRIRSSGSTQTRRRQEIRFSELEKSQELEDTEAREDDLELEPSFDGPTHEPDRLLNTALSSMAEGLVAVGANSQILLINDALKRFLDLTDRDDLVGRNFEDVLLEVSARGDLGPGDPVAAANSFADRLDRVARAEEPAFEWALPDGRTCLVSSDLLPDEGSIFTFTDVTEQRNALRVMASARDAAERGNKTKTEFLTRISHELRTPLNSIIGFAGMLRNETLGPLGAKDYREYASNIGDAGETLLAQINAILDVARIEAGTIKLTEAIIDPRAILEAAITAAMATAASREVAFSHFIAPDLPAMRADETRLGQIVAHLLDNALKFSTPGSQVMIRALADHFEGITISVSDEGIGMTDEQVNNAFEPFAQADTALDRQFEGTGLGLSMVKGLVDLHGGRITIASVPNQGTTVSVIFPPERMVLTL